MRLFDFHCDTPFALERRGELLTQNGGHISLEKASGYENYGQVMAIWSQKSLTAEEAWERFFVIRDDFLSKLPQDKATICTDGAQYLAAVKEGKSPFLFAVEGAGLLNGRMERLYTLYENGVRFLTPVWRDEDCIGGAFNTDAGLTPFGREVIDTCFALGIVPDLSHASDVMTEEILNMAREKGRPVVATHSNSRAVCDHKRNLTDETARGIASLGGVFGVNMVPFHLEKEGPAGVDSVCRHVLHFLSIGLEDAVALGCDFDGMDETPEGIRGVGDLTAVMEKLSLLGVSDTQIEKLFWRNADRFLRTLPVA